MICIEILSNPVTLRQHTPASTCPRPNRGLITCRTYSCSAISLVAADARPSISLHRRHSSSVRAKSPSSISKPYLGDPFEGAFCIRSTFPIYATWKKKAKSSGNWQMYISTIQFFQMDVVSQINLLNHFHPILLIPNENHRKFYLARF